MRHIVEIFLNEIRLVSSQRSLFLTLLVAPILYAFLYGSIYINKDQPPVKIAVVDEDHTNISRQFVNEVHSSTKVESHIYPTVAVAREAMYRGDVQGYIEIAPGMEEKLLSQRQANVSMYINTSQFLPTGALMSSLNEIAMTVGGGVRKAYFEKQGEGSEAAMQLTNPIKFDYRPLYNTDRNYGSFIIPGLLAIILQQTLLIAVCAAMSFEKQSGSLASMLRKYSFSDILTGKSIFYLISSSVLAFFIVAVNFTILDASFRGSYRDGYIITLLFLCSVITLGMLLGTFFPNPLMTYQVMGFSSYPIFLISGYSLPLQALPQGIQDLAACLPTTPFLKAYGSIVQTGARLSDHTEQVVHILILWVFYAFLLQLRFIYLRRRDLKAKTNIRS
ncbi:ABC-2 type transport system permease protein [Cruoricaptor ignavus]|uniref:ABC-2 type transport system permease protein n=1 Tax=Cruoricaptor ignavus TaxID=1118202 RepID=A0A1M6EMW1_9FLAO|nr:ABC transporter permease [Cruoricaptor ignavus]SHI86832.1 ABC-2 type transport system permease protein [Cruoricaptor ignavus]